MTREEAITLYRQGEEVVVPFLMQITTQIKELQTQVADLQARLGINSQNSSKPPSSDGYNKPDPKSQRQLSGKKRGGQPGHQGETLCQVENPDEVIVYSPECCADCGADLSATPIQKTEKRQEFDIPPTPKFIVTEHQSVTKICPCCQHQNQGAFPKRITRQVQYGPEIESKGVYLMTAHLLPLERAADCLEVFTGLRPNEATLINQIIECGEALAPTEEIIKQALLNSEVAHSDETGIRCQKQLFWLHTFTNKSWTYLELHKSKNKAAMDEIGLLPKYKGISVHDCLKAYFSYDCPYALCNAHLARELTYIHEKFNQPWAWHLRLLLLSLHHTVESAKHRGETELSAEIVVPFEKRY